MLQNRNRMVAHNFLSGAGAALICIHYCKFYHGKLESSRIIWKRDNKNFPQNFHPNRPKFGLTTLYDLRYLFFYPVLSIKFILLFALNFISQNNQTIQKHCHFCTTANSSIHTYQTVSLRLLKRGASNKNIDSWFCTFLTYWSVQMTIHPGSPIWRFLLKFARIS
jgi:hypothetical protein